MRQTEGEAAFKGQLCATEERTVTNQTVKAQCNRISGGNRTVDTDTVGGEKGDADEEVDRTLLWERIAIRAEEKLYRLFYQENPAAYEEPVSSWEEFCGRFANTALEGKLPQEPPTFIASFLEESSFFSSDPEEDMALVVNCAYCPPFLHRLAFVKIVYVLRGSCFFFLNGRKRTMEEGDFCMVGPGVEQAVYSCHEEDMVVNLIMRFGTFSESFLGLMTEQGVMSEFLWRMLYGRSMCCLMCRSKDRNELLSENVWELVEEIVLEKQKSNLIRKSLLLIFCGNVLRLHADHLLILGEGYQKEGLRFSAMLQYLNTHLDCSLPEFAEYFGVSESYMSRYIKKETGRTYSSLLREFRMKRAARMLVSTDFSVDKIVELTGYTDKSRFYRNFLEMYGVPPVKYRNGGAEQYVCIK